jgi:glucan phosphoethanolaminetransferase (alkaline phosphatase superfamily)
MKFPARPQSKLVRAGIAMLALWIFAAIFFVLLNRYRYGSDWDSIADLILLAFFLPASLISLGIASWAAGRRASVIAMSIVLAGAFVAASLSAYQVYRHRQAAQAAKIQREKEFEEIEAKFAARCESEKSSTKEGQLDPYVLCLIAEDMAAKRIR